MTKNTFDRKAYQKAYYQKYKENAKTRSQKSRKENPTKASIYSKRYRAKCKYEVIKYYSHGTMKCACCGDDHYEFLCIDHINGGGKKEQKAIGHGNIAQRLVSQHFPMGFRVLCHNCNMSLGFYGYCPHQKKEKTDYGELPSALKQKR